MKHKLSDLRHMNAWIVSNIVVLVVFTLYSVFVSDYTISHLATPAILNTGGLSLYHFCGLLWLAIIYERLDTKLVYASAAIALVAWHTSFWGNFSMLTTEVLAGGIDNDPSFRFFDKQSAILYIYLFGWAGVCVKAIKHKLPDLSMLALSGGVLLAILTGYHLIGYWSVFAQGDLYTTRTDELILPTLSNLSKEELVAACSMFDGIECYRFNIFDGYPEQFLNYQGAFANSIISLAEDPISHSVDFNYTYLFRDTLFEDNYTEYYSRSIYFSQGGGTVDAVITNYFGDLSVNFLSFTCWMMIGAMVFWQWLLVGVGLEHSVRMARRPRKTTGKLRLVAFFCIILFISPFMGFVGLDYFFGEHLTLFFVVIGMFGGSLFFAKAWKSIFFLLVALTLSTPAIYIYVMGHIDLYKQYDPVAIRDLSLNALIITMAFVGMALPLINMLGKKYFSHKTEGFWMAWVFVVLAVLFTYIGTHMIFPSLIADSEKVRLDTLLGAGKPFVEFCKSYPFDVCQTVNDPQWKDGFYKPMMESVWYMVTSGIIVLGATLYLMIGFAHKR